MTEIRIEYDEIQAIISLLAEQQEHAQRINRSLIDRVDQLRGIGWEGENADLFFAQADDEFLPALARLDRAFDQLAMTFQQSIQIFQEAEGDAAGLFNGVMGGLIGAHPIGKITNFKPDQNVSINVAGIQDGSVVGPSDANFIYVNGIQNSPDDLRNTLQYLNNELGIRTKGIYNATDGKLDVDALVDEASDIIGVVTNPGRWSPAGADEIISSSINIGKNLGGLFGDLFQVGNDQLDAATDMRFDGSNPAVESLIQQIKSHEGPLTLIGHSQGGAIVAAALTELSRENFSMNHITVTTLGGAGVNFPDGPTYNHVVNSNDNIPGVSRSIPRIFDSDNVKNLDKITYYDTDGSSDKGHVMETYYDDLERLHGSNKN
jgi:WXG100 family type VII secretion target